YYCAIASSTSGTSFGSIQNFTTTPPPAAPTVTTLTATSTATTSASLPANANPNGTATTGWFRYATTTDPGTCSDSFGTKTSTVSLGSGITTVFFARTIGGLASSTTYFYCAIASSTAGLATGTVLNLTTTP
ncbi:hypothetical protein KW798_03375, partial [Candidatus Parcubacteria bacterium]|nr:hypothetical protein [Candidatus Parcubacteria bacterium]